ncbi:MAG: iron ABC transporter permease [Deltaproteobacteria bacterium]|nr:iron ABC transporter permease [Deltaproteobacteria bacterium]
MNLNQRYKKYRQKKVSTIILLTGLIIASLIVSLSIGAAEISPVEVIKILLGQSNQYKWEMIVVNIRLPQAIAAIVAGFGLAIAGVAMQAILNNPLGAPFTLGITHAAAFGAALSVVLLGTGTVQNNSGEAVKIDNHYLTTVVAFLFCVAEAAFILMVAKLKKTSPEVMVLAGIAMGFLFFAGTMFLQYLADDIQLAAMVFWTFGDLSRADWKEVFIMTVATVPGFMYFQYNSWNYNVLSSGEEAAKSMGIRVDLLRTGGLFISVVLTAVIISFLGIIGFVGLICPHMMRRIVGDDHRFLVPASALCGAILLLLSDTIARVILLPHVLPVAVLTSFLGAPLFVYLLVKGYRR